MSRKKISPMVRFEIFKRDGFRCRYCGHSGDDAVLVLDHLIAVARGGKTTVDNLVTSCTDCNLGKGAKPLYELATIKISDRQPRQPADPAKRTEYLRLKAQEARRAKGAVPRAEYLAQCHQGEASWIAAGVSKATWYRHKRQEPCQNPSSPQRHHTHNNNPANTGKSAHQAVR